MWLIVAIGKPFGSPTRLGKGGPSLVELQVESLALPIRFVQEFGQCF